MANNYNNDRKQDFQAPVVYEPVDTVLEKFGFADNQAKAFIYAEAAIMKVDAGLLDIPENIAEVVKAACYTRDYGYVPGIHLHMTPFRSKAKRKLPNGATVEVWEDRLSLVVGEQAYKASARYLAQQDGDHIDFEWEPLTPDEVRAYVAANMPKDFELTDEDYGVRARVLSMKDAQIRVAMGRKYDPQWSYGFCFMKGSPRVNNQGVKSYPKSDRDRIPNQRVALDVAMRRAIKAAIMQKYHLVPLDSQSQDQRVARVIQDAQPSHGSDWMPAARNETREDDGDVLYYDDEPAHRAQRAPATANADEDTIDGAFSELAEDQADEAPDILDDESVHEVVRGFVVDLRKQDAGRPASDKQHKYAVGIIDGICGKDAHRPVLGAIFGREVGGDRPLAESAAKAIFRLLSKVKSIKIDGEWKKTDNSEYSTESVEFVCAVAKWAGVDMAEKVAA